MNTAKCFLLLLIVSCSFSVRSSTYQSYESLTKGLGPAEAWMVGANKLMDYIFIGPESACRFMSEMSASVKLENMLYFAKQQEEFENLGWDEGMPLTELAYLICIRSGLFSSKPPISMSDKKVTSEQVIQEFIYGDTAVVKARFANGSIKNMQLVFEGGVWKPNGIIPD